MSECRVLYLSKRSVVRLILYYSFLLIFGLAFAVLALSPSLMFEAEFKMIDRALIGSMGMALSGASIYYIRKIYKLCFSDKLRTDCEDCCLQHVGTLAYFLARPFFSLGFSILVVVGLQGGFLLTRSDKLQLDDGMLFTAMFLSFFVGFLTGRFIKNMERFGGIVIEKVSK